MDVIAVDETKLLDAPVPGQQLAIDSTYTVSPDDVESNVVIARDSFRGCGVAEPPRASQISCHLSVQQTPVVRGGEFGCCVTPNQKRFIALPSTTNVAPLT